MWGLLSGDTSVPPVTSVHPHVCGVYESQRLFKESLIRFIPTYVGFTVVEGQNFPVMAVHPHVCGVYAGDHIGLTEVGRFIPTYVGFTKKALRRCTYTAVHPHVCGVYVLGQALNGLPQRFIPTYVGFTECVASLRGSDAVHPHVCGVYGSRGNWRARNIGSSPRMWGLQGSIDSIEIPQRFIPTYVGFTEGRGGKRGRFSVHPHVCGVYSRRPLGTRTNIGSSPRMWGLHPLLLRHVLKERFIPTYVGFTERDGFQFVERHGSSPRMWGLQKKGRHEMKAQTVHPHVCGVYGRVENDGVLTDGSSPRMWGLPEEWQ